MNIDSAFDLAQKMKEAMDSETVRLLNEKADMYDVGKMISYLMDRPLPDDKTELGKEIAQSLRKIAREINER